MQIDIIMNESILYRYEIYEYKRLVDKLVLTKRKDEEVIDRARVMFNGGKRKFQVFLNGEMIYNFRNRVKRILNTENGQIYNSVVDMAYNENISVYMANKWLKNKFKFKFIDE